MKNKIPDIAAFLKTVFSAEFGGGVNLDPLHVCIYPFLSHTWKYKITTIHFAYKGTKTQVFLLMCIYKGTKIQVFILIYKFIFKDTKTQVLILMFINGTKIQVFILIDICMYQK